MINGQPQQYVWHVVLSKIIDGKVIPSPNNPIRSGLFLCTCYIKHDGRAARFLDIKQYDIMKREWHDIDRPDHITGAVLAWTDIQMCDYNHFDYVLGAILEPGTLK